MIPLELKPGSRTQQKLLLDGTSGRKNLTRLNEGDERRPIQSGVGRRRVDCAVKKENTSP